MHVVMRGGDVKVDVEGRIMVKNLIQPDSSVTRAGINQPKLSNLFLTHYIPPHIAPQTTRTNSKETCLIDGDDWKSLRRINLDRLIRLGPHIHPTLIWVYGTGGRCRKFDCRHF